MLASGQKDVEMEDAQELDETESGLGNTLEAVDITAVTPPQGHDTCCADPEEHSPVPSLAKSKPKLVIGLPGDNKSSRAGGDLDKEDDDFADEPVLEGARRSSLEKISDVEVIEVLGEDFHRSSNVRLLALI